MPSRRASRASGFSSSSRQLQFGVVMALTTRRIAIGPGSWKRRTSCSTPAMKASSVSGALCGGACMSVIARAWVWPPRHSTKRRPSFSASSNTTAEASKGMPG